MDESIARPAATAPRPPVWANDTIAKIVIAAVVLLFYLNSLACSFVFDDFGSIPENPTIQDIGRLQTVLSPPPLSTVAGRPILNLSLALNYALDGLKVQGYHIFNIVFHIISALLLYGILRRTLELPSVSARYRRASVPLAFGTAFLWALHPMQTGSVTYIIQRAESLMGLFYLLTLYCALRAATDAKSIQWTIGAIASCALGMGTKEAMVTAPIVVLLYDRIFLSASWRELLNRRKFLHAGLVATWILLAVLMSATGTRGGTAGFGLPYTWWQYALTQFGVIFHYLRLAVWPAPLVLDYGWPIATSAVRIILPAIPVLGLLGLSIWALRRHPAAGFLGLSFFLILAPTSSIVPIRDAAFEHRMYLPLACFLALIVMGAYRLLARGAPAEAHQDDLPAPLVHSAVSRVILASVLIGALFGFLTMQRNKDYSSEIAIWEDTVAKRPQNWRAHDVLGIAFAKTGDFPTAIEKHTEALRLNPSSAISYYNRGTTYLRSRMFQEAIEDLSSSVRLDRQGDTYSNRAVAHFQVREYLKAKADVDSSLIYHYRPHPEFLGLLRDALMLEAPDSVSAGAADSIPEGAAPAPDPRTH